MTVDFTLVIGASLIAEDGQFLGKVCDEFDQDSILNEFGDYGSEFSEKSIRNDFSDYGSEFSHKSAYNEFTMTPPRLINGKILIGYVTKNEFLSPGVDPDVLIDWAKTNL